MLVSFPRPFLNLEQKAKNIFKTAFFGRSVSVPKKFEKMVLLKGDFFK
jgi:hypothetical protein